MLDPEHTPGRKKRGFSLVELLCVVAVIGVMFTMAVPMLGDMAASMRRTQSLSSITALLEGARQHAVANNTYVWVAFNESEESKPLQAAVFASRTGLAEGYGPEDIWATKTVDTTASGSSYQLVTRVASIDNYQIEAIGESFAQQGPILRVKTSSSGQVDFKRCIQFTPQGEAKIGPGIQGQILYDTYATRGRMAGQKDRILINGPAGMIRVEAFDKN